MNEEIIIIGNPDSYSFKVPGKIYHARLTGNVEDGNQIVKTDEPIIFGKTEYDKFSVQRDSFFYAGKLRQEIAAATGNPHVRLSDNLSAEDANVFAEIYLPKNRCRIRYAEFSRQKDADEGRGEIVIAAEILSNKPEDCGFCVVCLKPAERRTLCGHCKDAAGLGGVVKVWELHHSGRRTNFLGAFLSREKAENSIRALCRRHAIESGAIDEFDVQSDKTISDDFWEIKTTVTV